MNDLRPRACWLETATFELDYCWYAIEPQGARRLDDERYAPLLKLVTDLRWRNRPCLALLRCAAPGHARFAILTGPVPTGRHDARHRVLSATILVEFDSYAEAVHCFSGHVSAGWPLEPDRSRAMADQFQELAASGAPSCDVASWLPQGRQVETNLHPLANDPCGYVAPRTARHVQELLTMMAAADEVCPPPAAGQIQPLALIASRMVPGALASAWRSLTDVGDLSDWTAQARPSPARQAGPALSGRQPILRRSWPRWVLQRVGRLFHRQCCGRGIVSSFPRRSFDES
jgi:hypothetical protein